MSSEICNADEALKAMPLCAQYAQRAQSLRVFYRHVYIHAELVLGHILLLWLPDGGLGSDGIVALVVQFLIVDNLCLY